MSDAAVVIDAAPPQCPSARAFTGLDSPHPRLKVMPARATDERLELCECRVGDHRVDARYRCLDPSLLHETSGHVLFLAVLAHYEDILHAWACQRLGRDGGAVAPERVKVWPSIAGVSMPRGPSLDREVVQEVHIEDVCAIDAQRYLVKSRSHVNHCLIIEGKTPILVL